MSNADDTAGARCRRLAQSIRRWTVEQSFRSGVGHIGSALSIADIVAVLWADELRDYGSDRPERDRFILSKGHAVLAVYCALRWSGSLSDEALSTYCADGSLVAGHPLHRLPGIELSTGSLGQGLSVACGLAYGLRLRKSASRVYVLVSDGECNEGQVWEAAMFAAHHKLRNLTVIVDANGSQCMGTTPSVLKIANQAELWRSFGWHAENADGHSVDELIQTLRRPFGDGPRVIVAHTTLGKGVSFMEGRFEWHYRSLDSQQAEAALAELALRGS